VPFSLSFFPARRSGRVIDLSVYIDIRYTPNLQAKSGENAKKVKKALVVVVIVFPFQYDVCSITDSIYSISAGYNPVNEKIGISQKLFANYSGASFFHFQLTLIGLLIP